MRTLTKTATDARDRYLDAFRTFEAMQPQNGDGISWLRELRTAAIRRFEELGFPTTRDEEWKYTDISPIANLIGSPADAAQVQGLSASDVEPFTLQGLDALRLVFVNGHYAEALSSVGTLPKGVVLSSLAAAIRSDSPVVRSHLAQYASFENHTFVALNTAFFQDGAFLYVPDNTVVETPIQLLFITTSGETATIAHPRNLIVAGANSQVTLVESYVSTGQGTYFNNPVTEVVVNKNATFRHHKVQLESEQAYHIATMQVQQARDCQFASLAVSFGGSIARYDANAVMADQGIECTLNGVYLVAGQQHIDNHTVMDHAQPHCNSHENYAGILDGQARGVFNGKIFVREDAQKTDAKQSNRNLLLSPNAVINTKPQLEIFADDVKCTHGATIGQLDEDAIFYLRARGIDKEEARDMLVHAFASDLLTDIQIEPLRQQLEQELHTRLARNRQIRE
ncbi:MAG: Fe-S cluster assembly protein SufD [Abitibacteriaceae bacterium]|nr:Fe-S cluster assembly protein SufD [Abditibacteriaceae bacterium]